MGWLLSGLIFACMAVFILNWVVGVDAHKLGRVIKFISITGFIAIAGALIATGRIGIVLIILSFLLPFIIGRRRYFQQRKNAAGPSQGQQSHIETPFLRMVLDHDSGVMDGEILHGPFQGKYLSELTEVTDLVAVYMFIQDDLDSLRLLESWLDRTYVGDWRADFDQVYEHGSAGEDNTSQIMTRARAFEILELPQSASEAEIKASHRRLMKTAHPDHGGSDQAATLLNRAKDVLLGG